MSRFTPSSFLFCLSVSAILLASTECAVAQQRNLTGGGASASGAAGGGAQGTADVSSMLRSLNTGAGIGGGATQSDFVGRGNATGQFIGGQQGSQQGGNNQARNFNRTQTNNFNRSRNTNTSNRFGRTSSSTGSFRPAQRIAFSFPKRSTSSVGSSLKTRFSDISQLSSRAPSLKNVNFGMGDGGTVTLTGAVESERTKRLAAVLVRLEPGVRVVKNELTVTTSTPGT
jgi:hypothetical protein